MRPVVLTFAAIAFLIAPPATSGGDMEDLKAATEQLLKPSTRVMLTPLWRCITTEQLDLPRPPLSQLIMSKQAKPLCLKARGIVSGTSNCSTSP